MTAPAVQDPREDMQLHCQFDMGGEDLYAVKWYKDDHEFFRYTPSQQAGGDSILFPVDGVEVDGQRSRCSRDSCGLVLVNLARPDSSGAYRCEVSSEAPAFRLAAQTHNVTVAALPYVHPKIEGMVDTYLLGSLLIATCTSGAGDPKPLLTWYINKQQVSSKYVKELPPRSVASSNQNERIKLKSSMVQLRYPLDRKLTQGLPTASVEISCVSSLEGASPSVAPHLASSSRIVVVDQTKQVNNQMLHSPLASATHHLPNLLLLLLYLLTLLVSC